MDSILAHDMEGPGLRHEIEMPEDPRYRIAFPKLTPAQIKALEDYGTRKTFAKGEAVWTGGTVDLCMYVIIQGELQIVDPRTGLHIATHVTGSFSGDIDILSGRASLVNGIAGTDLEVLQVPADCVRIIVGERPELGEIILRAYLMRRALLIETGKAALVVVGSRYDPNTLRIREFLARNLYPVVWEDLETNPDTLQVLGEFHIKEDETPVVVLPSGDVLRVPTNTQLAEALGIKKPADSKIYDLVIVGAGPAGLAAAVYGASEGLSTLVLDATGPGGQAGTSSKIENYMGFPLGLTGQELADGALVQAEKFGARFILPARVKEITCREIGGHAICLDDGEKIECKCVILAPGAQYRKLDFDGHEKFDGRGVYYAATYIEQMMCGGSRVGVVGGGNSAGQAAVFMAEKALEVLLVVRGGNLRDTMSSYLARRIEGMKKISVLLHSEVCGINGRDALEAMTVTNSETKAEKTEKVAALFVMIGASPHTDWLPDGIERDNAGFILTGPQLTQAGAWDQDRPPFFLETACPGVFAAGDCRANSVKRVASAVGEGAMAVAFVHQYLSSYSFPSQPAEHDQAPAATLR